MTEFAKQFIFSASMLLVLLLVPSCFDNVGKSSDAADGDEELPVYWPIIASSIPNDGDQKLHFECGKVEFTLHFAEPPPPEMKEIITGNWYLGKKQSEEKLLLPENTGLDTEGKMSFILDFEKHSLERTSTYSFYVEVNENRKDDDSQDENNIDPFDRRRWTIDFFEEDIIEYKECSRQLGI